MHSIQPVQFVIRVSHHITKCDVIIARESCSPATCTVRGASCEVAFSRNHCIPAPVIMTTQLQLFSVWRKYTMNKMLFTYLLVDWYEMNLCCCYDCVYDFRNESMFIIFITASQEIFTSEKVYLSKLKLLDEVK